MKDPEEPEGVERPRVHQLGYGLASYRDPDGAKKKSFLSLRTSLLLLLCQIPMFCIFGVGFAFSRMGRSKSLLIDTLIDVFIALPSILAMTVAVRERHELDGQNDKPDPAFTVTILLFAIAFFVYMVVRWYSDVWLDSTGRWDSI